MMVQLSVIMTILSLFLDINATAVDETNDTISSSQPLTRNQTIVSAGQLFELGFFSPGNSNKWFIGIWYKELQMNSKIVVWVANRDNPLATSSGTLKIYKNRKLILTNERGKTIWQSNHTTPSSNTVAQLLDTGNFVVRRKEDSDPKSYLWQSFDYPTDTLLPGMKLGMDNKTDRFLTSWKNDDDPSIGDFSYKLNIIGVPEFILWKKDQTKVYRSWYGIDFSNFHGVGTERLIFSSFVMDRNENAYSFGMTDKSKYSRLSLNSYGVLQSFLWIPMSQRWNVFWYAPYDHCDMYKVCGPFGICDTTRVKSLCGCMNGFEPKIIQEWNLNDWSRGCTRTDELNCLNDGFISVNYVKLPESSTAVLNGSKSWEDCKNECQKDCSCTACAVDSNRGCVTWKGDLTDLRKYQRYNGEELLVRVPKVLDGEPEIPDESYWKRLWDDWNMRVIVLSSLFLQIFLLFFSPLRKRTSRSFVTMLLWTAYLSSPAISSYGFGLINANIASKKYTNTYLHGLWSPFLLLHLSKPDTITAFSLEDNHLWMRKLINFVVYCFYIGWAIMLFIEMTIDAIYPGLVCVVGLTKNARWIDTLRFANSVGTDVDIPKRDWLMITTMEDVSGSLSDLQVLKHAYMLFTRFRGLMVDLSFTFSKCSESRDLFIRLMPRDAFRVVERELNFFYEVTYTKAWILQTWSAFLWRVAQFVAILVAFVLFFYREDRKKKIKTADKVTTYLLFSGSIFLEASAMIMVLNSDWFIAYLRSRNGFLKHIGTCLTFFTAFLPKIVHRRWCNCISQYNLLKYCLRPRKERLEDSESIFRMMFWKTIESLRYVESLKFNDDIKDFIITQLKNKSSISYNPSTAREIQSARGNWVLCNESCRHLLPWIDGLDFNQILLTWHVATDLCFHTDNGDNSDRKLSKGLSDYMFYLLMWQPEMMYTVDARVETRFKETCDEVRQFFHEKNIRKTRKNEPEVLKKACEAILLIDREVSMNTSVLMDARRLAEKLRELGETRQWEVLSKVWVEILCYAASHCKASAHMKQIQQGGQLLTIVWPLMVHFGLVN